MDVFPTVRGLTDDIVLEALMAEYSVKRKSTLASGSCFGRKVEEEWNHYQEKTGQNKRNAIT